MPFLSNKDISLHFVLGFSAGMSYFGQSFKTKSTLVHNLIRSFSSIRNHLHYFKIAPVVIL